MSVKLVILLAVLLAVVSLCQAQNWPVPLSLEDKDDGVPIVERLRRQLGAGQNPDYDSISDDSQL